MSGAFSSQLRDAQDIEHPRLYVSGVEPGHGIHILGAGLIYERVGQHHGAEFETAIEYLSFG
jgi:hypothetical protein